MCAGSKDRISVGADTNRAGLLITIDIHVGLQMLGDELVVGREGHGAGCLLTCVLRRFRWSVGGWRAVCVMRCVR